MPAGKYDLVVRKNEHWAETFTWTDAAGTAINLTGYTAKMEVRAAPGTTVILTLTTANSRIVITALTGVVAISVPVAVLDTIAAGTYAYDLVLFDAALIPIAFLKGSVIVEDGITDVV